MAPVQMPAAVDEIREASAADRPAVAEALAEAFFDDPVTMWATPRDRLRPWTLRRFFAVQFAGRLERGGLVYCDRARCGAALWAPPNAWKITLREDLLIASSFAHPAQWLRGPMVGYGLLGIEHRHPGLPPHMYLAALGVRPPAQGRGLGSRLMQPVLALCDTDGVPAYLESSKESNIAFYARHGFRVSGEIRLPRGPTMYAMWRDPRA